MRGWRLHLNVGSLLFCDSRHWRFTYFLFGWLLSPPRAHRCVAENDLRGYGQHLWQMEISHHGEGGTWKSAFSHPTLQRSHSYPNLDTIYSWVHLGITFVILFFLIHKFRLTKWYTPRCQEKRKDSERSEFGEEMCNIWLVHAWAKRFGSFSLPLTTLHLLWFKFKAYTPPPSRFYFYMCGSEFNLFINPLVGT